MNERVNEYDELYDDIYDYGVNEVLNVKDEVVNCELKNNLDDGKLISEYNSINSKYGYVNNKKINIEEQHDNKENLSHELKVKNSNKKNIENKEYDDKTFHNTQNLKEKENNIEDFERKDIKNHIKYNINECNNISVYYNKNKTTEILMDDKQMKKLEADHNNGKLKSNEKEINNKNNIDEQNNIEEVDISDNINQKSSNNNDKEKNEFYENKSNTILKDEYDNYEIEEKENYSGIINKNSINKTSYKDMERKKDTILKEDVLNEKSENNKSKENEFQCEENEKSKLKEDLLKHEKYNEHKESKEDNIKCEEKKDDINKSEESGTKQKNLNKNVSSESENRNTFECNICFDDVRDPVVTKCGHLFCWLCLCSWIKKNNDCPVCKAEVSRENVIPLYGRGKSSNEHKYANVEEPRPTPKRKESVRRNNNCTNNLGLRASFGVWVNPFSFGLSYTNMSEEPHFNNNRNENRRAQTETFHAEAASSFFFFLGFFLSLYILFYSS